LDFLKGEMLEKFECMDLETKSRAAFNRDKSQGLFAVSNSCGGLCGGGAA
jgi:hypothetical protein